MFNDVLCFLIPAQNTMTTEVSQEHQQETTNGGDMFPGILRKPSGEWYYKSNTIEMVEVPIDTCDGDFPLTYEQLQYYFGIAPLVRSKLPKYLIVLLLHSASLHSCDFGPRYALDITGEVAVYTLL